MSNHISVFETEYREDGSIHRRISRTVKSGISFGSCLAMVISYVSWQSVGWAIIHGLLGWLYVIYFMIVYH